MESSVKEEVRKFAKSYEKEAMVPLRGKRARVIKGADGEIIEEEDGDDNSPFDLMALYDSRWVDRLL